mmetsp:Transcript_10463/g.25606  ORF Transcript_10463/g.25606 Transcript_10463/m.25606 type:complete len:236 (-) Transcript_10463:409-1116(-)
MVLVVVWRFGFGPGLRIRIFRFSVCLANAVSLTESGGCHGRGCLATVEERERSRLLADGGTRCPGTGAGRRPGDSTSGLALRLRAIDAPPPPYVDERDGDGDTDRTTTLALPVVLPALKSGRGNKCKGLSRKPLDDPVECRFTLLPRSSSSFRQLSTSLSMRDEATSSIQYSDTRCIGVKRSSWCVRQCRFRHFSSSVSSKSFTQLASWRSCAFLRLLSLEVDDRSTLLTQCFVL